MISYFRLLILFLVFVPAYSTQTVQFNIRTPMDLKEEQQIFTENICKLLEFITLKGYHATLGEAYRTHEQALIYAHKGMGIVNSQHCERLAIDLNIFDQNEKRLVSVEDYKLFGDYWESLHIRNRWGGIFKHRPDANHFEMMDRD